MVAKGSLLLLVVLDPVVELGVVAHARHLQGDGQVLAAGTVTCNKN